MFTREDLLKKVAAKSRRAYYAAWLFSCAINLLMLTGPLFMLQVYDRVLASQSVPTLVALFALVVALYLFLMVFDVIRAKVLSRIGYSFEVELSSIANRAWINSGLHPSHEQARPLRDLATIRQFMSSNGWPAIFDLPWLPVYLFIIYMLHSWLGILATIGALIVVLATAFAEFVTRKPVSEAFAWEIKDINFSEASNRSAESIIAMGMTGNVSSYWQKIRAAALLGNQNAGSRTEFITSFIKAVRLILQSAMLALGAYLAILQEITPGVMIAGSILSARALAPIDAVAANWKNYLTYRGAMRQLKKSLEPFSSVKEPIALPAPKGEIIVRNLLKKVPNAASEDVPPILNGVTFGLLPGDGLGIIGPSGSGKSSLAKLITGIWKPDGGEVRFSGATYDQWNRDELGQFIGYLPQNVDLVPGTIAQNISRFEPNPDTEAVFAAAKLAGVHELILQMPGGYEADLGTGELVLSGGQLQRVALARAVYKSPPLVVLDEPNANLDMQGDEALAKAVIQLRKSGSCVVVVAHRPSALVSVNKALALVGGRQVDFGERDKVLANVTNKGPN